MSEKKTIKPSSAHESLARYVNANTDQEVTPEQVGAMLTMHGKWQSSDERKAEREQERADKAKNQEEAKAARQAAKEAKAAERAEEKTRKAEAKKAAQADSEAALDSDDGEDDQKPNVKKRRTRRKPISDAAE